MYATLLSPSVKIVHELPRGGGQKKAYIMVPQTSGHNTGAPTGARVRVRSLNGAQLELREGDAAYIVVDGEDVIETENVGDKVAEIVLFDIED